MTIDTLSIPYTKWVDRDGHFCFKHFFAYRESAEDCWKLVHRWSGACLLRGLPTLTAARGVARRLVNLALVEWTHDSMTQFADHEKEAIRGVLEAWHTEERKRLDALAAK